MANLNRGGFEANDGGNLEFSSSAFYDALDRTEGDTRRIIKGISWDVWGTLLSRAVESETVAATRAGLIARVAGIDIGTALECLDFGHPDEEAGAGEGCIGLPVAERLALALSKLGDSALDFPALAESLSDLPIGKQVEAIDHSREVLHRLASFQHVIICNTEWTSGRTLRQMLAGMFPTVAFRSMVFSDEAGWAKPSPKVFDAAWKDLGIHPHETVHIGDRANRDMAGARATGAAAVISRVARRAREKGDTTADAILYDYRGLPALLDHLQERAGSSDREPIAEGLPVWGPLVVGRVRKVERPDDESFLRTEQGSIIVLNNSSPDFLPYFHRAGAVLAEVGGYGSHAAQTAPLCDVPCVVGLDSLYDRLDEDDLVLVDALQGRVFRLGGDD